MTDKLIISEDDKLYTNNTGRKSFQWELWQYCNSLCKFCYLGKENRIHNKARQIQSLKDLSLSVEHLDYTKYNNISIIGGEFFQGQLDDKETHDLFFKVIKQLAVFRHVVAEVLERLLLGIVFYLCEVLVFLKHRADMLRLFFGDVFFQVYRDLVRVFDVLHDGVHIHHQQNGAAHQQQADHEYAEARKGHQQVFPHGGDSLFYKVCDITRPHLNLRYCRQT